MTREQTVCVPLIGAIDFNIAPDAAGMGRIVWGKRHYGLPSPLVYYFKVLNDYYRARPVVSAAPPEGVVEVPDLKSLITQLHECAAKAKYKHSEADRLMCEAANALIALSARPVAPPLREQTRHEDSASAISGGPDRASGDRGPVVHELKCWPIFFEEVVALRKQFEIRRNDRDYRADDVLRIREWSPVTMEYTSREVWKRVSYITDFEQQPGFVVMSLGYAEARAAVDAAMGSPDEERK